MQEASRIVLYNRVVTVTVLLFASVAEKAGRRSVDLPSSDGDTVQTVCERLFAGYPDLRAFGPRLLYAINEEYAQADDPVPPGATLALIPPVSGGQ
jgi:molybdopterin converting factor subunit 1